VFLLRACVYEVKHAFDHHQDSLSLLLVFPKTELVEGQKKYEISGSGFSSLWMLLFYALFPQNLFLGEVKKYAKREFFPFF
jgi:hypothetical protein